MRTEITEKMKGWAVEAGAYGTYYVPGSIVRVPGYLKVGGRITPAEPNGLFEAFLANLADYVPPVPVDAIEVCEGYFARTSNPGYLDCTDWSFFRTKADAVREMRRLYG
jgi:hypothetical protein